MTIVNIHRLPQYLAIKQPTSAAYCRRLHLSPLG